MKKTAFISLILVFIVALSPMFTIAATAESKATVMLMGDVDGDGKVSVLDATAIQRIVAKLIIPTEEMLIKAKVTGGDEVTILDATEIQRYIAKISDNGNINVEVPSEEYTVIFKDYDGSVLYAETVKWGMSANAPETPQRDGYVFVKWDKSFDKVTEDLEITAVYEEGYPIIYHISEGDNYLESIIDTINNPNRTYYNPSQNTITLSNLIAPTGYVFLGWYDAPVESKDAQRVRTIPKGTTGDVELYAHWYKKEYSITYDSPLIPRETQYRTIDQGVSIPDLELHQYMFMGWTDDEGNLVDFVSPGTEDITLHANWVSYRNQTISNDYLEKGPIIIEDDEDNQYLFVYDIGSIINVPLYTIKDFGNNTSGIIVTESDSVTSSIETGREKTITDSVVKSTTNSATWTLSNDWNELVTNTEDFSETELEENRILISDGITIGDSTTTNTGTVKDTGTLTKNNTQTKDLTTYKHGNSAEGSVDVGIGKESWPVNVDISAKYEQHQDTTEEDGTIEDKGNDEYNITHTNNLTSKVDSSLSVHNEERSKLIAQSATKQWGYSISKSVGGSESASNSIDNSVSNTNTYSSTFKYTTTKTTTNVREYSTSSAAPGWHRLVCAGTVHVFAVVGYDIATHNYFYYTYSVLDDNTYEFYDYCKNNNQYNDYETGVLPFEVPVSVHEYISKKTYLTNGLIVDDQTGTIIDYEGESEYVWIPDYYSIDNDNGTFEAIKITGIADSLFENNTTIKEVRLSDYINTIPCNAFSGCTALESVEYNEIKSIEENAFANCTSLREFVVNDNVEEMGENAFVGVQKVHCYVDDSAVLQKAVSCGANDLRVDLMMNPSEISNNKLTTNDCTKEFTINGFKDIYDNLEIVSNADAVNINGITFNHNTGIPLTLNSTKVSLNNVNITNTNGMVLVLKADKTNVTIIGSNKFATTGETAILSKGLSINKQSGSSVKCELSIPSGKIYICGNKLTETDRKYLSVYDEQIVYIDSAEYANMLNSHYVIFDANGGAVDTSKKLVMWNSEIGELPVPSRDGCTFLGWYTEDGTQVTAETVFTSLEDCVVKAYWESGWVTTSVVPTDAEVTSEKWKYDLTSYTTSSSSSMSGWTLYDTTWVWGGYGSWSGWSRTAYTASDSRQVESKYYAATTKTVWKYSRDVNSAGTLSTYNLGYYGHCQYITLDYRLETTGTVDGHTRYGPYDGGYGSYLKNHWWNESQGTEVVTPAYYMYRYRDRSKVYTYHFKKVDALEATSDPTGQKDVSNIVKYVKYVIK